MTRKDYLKIANAIAAARDEIEEKEPEDDADALNDGIDYACEFLADALEQNNPAFQRNKFLAACGMED